MSERIYTESEVIQLLTNLVNGIGLCAKGDIMPKRYKQSVDICGQKHWVTGRTLKDLLEAYLELCVDKGSVVPPITKVDQGDAPLFGPYLEEFNKIYKSNQESLTKNSRRGIIEKHISPRWKDIPINKITTSAIQEWMNDLDAQGYSHETLLKIKNNMSPALDSAVEDGYISKNPFHSKRLIIGGTETVHHKVIPADKMLEIRNKLPDICDARIRNMAAILSYTGMRFEEVLGLRWEDLNSNGGWIYIQRAVVHPGRNLPEVKPPKSKTSERKIPLPKTLYRLLLQRSDTGYILYNYKDLTRETPLSYTEARNCFRKIREIFGIEGYSAHDFRDTCATEWRESGVPIDVISHLLGHSKSDITEKRYVKYRDELYQGVRKVMEHDVCTKKEQNSKDEVIA